MRRTRFDRWPCPIARTTDLIGDWWTLLIVRDALGGVTRFNDFQRSLGAAKSSLSTRLQALVERGIFEIRPASDGSAPTRQETTARYPQAPASAKPSSRAQY